MMTRVENSLSLKQYEFSQATHNPFSYLHTICIVCEIRMIRNVKTMANAKLDYGV